MIKDHLSRVEGPDPAKWRKI